jgi:hypothetical protein
VPTCRAPWRPGVPGLLDGFLASTRLVLAPFSNPARDGTPAVRIPRHRHDRGPITQCHFFSFFADGGGRADSPADGRAAPRHPRSFARYEALGWRGAEHPDDEVCFFQAGGMVFGLWTALGSHGAPGIELAHNLRSPEDVGALLADAERAGGTIVRPG